MSSHEVNNHTNIQTDLIIGRDFADLIHDSVIGYDQTGTILYWNRVAEQTLGWPSDEILGKPLTTITDAGAELPASPDLLEVSCGNPYTPQWEGEARYRHRDGSILIMDSRVVPRFDEGGEFVCMIAINQNVTLHRALEIKLNAHSVELERSNTELDNFARIASHDLREPLRMISSYAKLLDRRYRQQLDQAGGEFLDFITDGAERMSTMSAVWTSWRRRNRTKVSSPSRLSCSRRRVRPKTSPRAIAVTPTHTSGSRRNSTTSFTRSATSNRSGSAPFSCLRNKYGCSTDYSLACGG